MQVSCNQCGAKYEFDASVIPAEGYDAQCAACGAVFFVAPDGATQDGAGAEASAPEPAAPPSAESASEPSGEAVAPVAVSCAVCGARYEFSAADIPAEGYDAQCTECQAVFFVSADAAASSQPAPAEGEAKAEPVLLESPVPSAQPESAQPLPSDVAPGDESAGGTDAAVAGAAEPEAADQEGASDSEGWGEMMALNDELGEPAAAPDGASAEDDFEAMLRRRRRRLMAVGAGVGVAALYCVVTYFAAPRVFDLTVGRVVGIKLTVSPKAIPHARSALKTMMADTDAAYGKAITALDKALKIDPKYSDAIGYLGLAYTFRGADVQAEGRALFDEGAKAVAQIKGIESLPARRRPRDAKGRLAALREKAKKAETESTRKFEQGGKLVGSGLRQLKAALKRYQDRPMVTLASGIYYTTDPDSMGKAEQLLRFTMQNSGRRDGSVDLSNPPNLWAPYLQARLSAAVDTELDKAQRAYEAVLKKAPQFQRARFELAEVLQRVGKTEEAKKLAKQVLQAVPAHAKAQRLLRQLEAPTAAEASSAARRARRTARR